MGTVRDGIRPVQPQLDRYCQTLAAKLHLRAAAVFGSRARGDHWETSDIDLLVVSEDFQGMHSGQRPRPTARILARNPRPRAIRSDSPRVLRSRLAAALGCTPPGPSASR
jgi:hypothetical protein